MNRILSMTAAMAFVAGCAGPNPPPDSNSLILSDAVLALLQSDESITLGDDRIRCEQRQGLGTRFRETFCLTVKEFEQMRDWSLRDAYGPGQRRVN